MPASARALRTVLVANPSADLYGSDRMMLEAVRGLLAHDLRVIVTCSSDGPLLEQLEALGVDARVTPAPVIRKSMLTPRGMGRLIATIASSLPGMRRLIRSVDADLVISNTLTLPFWTLAARTCLRPAIVYVHEAESSLSAPARLLLTAPLGLARGAVFNSETSRTVCSANLLERRERALVVHNGVSGPLSTTPPRPRIDGPLRVVFVGRLSPRKGVDLVIEAAAALRDESVPVCIDIIGDVFPGYEWYEEALSRRVTECGMEDTVRFRGFRETVWDPISDADVMVVPSRGDESFGNVVIEALLCARPVIVADHSGLREAASQFSSVVRVPPDHAGALADAIRQVRSEWGARRLAALRDSETARERFSPARFHGEFTRAVERIAR